MIEGARARPSVLDAWSVLRARQWAVFVPLSAAGVVHPDELRGVRLFAFASAAVVTGLALAYAYGLNALAERGTDRDARKNVLAGRAEVPTLAVAAVGAAGLGAASGAALLGREPLVAVALSLLAATLYSVGPRLKHLPVAGLAANVLIFAPLMFTAVRPGDAPAPLAWLVAAFVALVVQNQLLHEQADAAEDAAAGALTTARWLGERGARGLIVACAGALVAAGATSRSPVAFAVALAGAAASIAVALAPRPAAWRRRAHRYVAATVGASLFLVLHARGARSGGSSPDQSETPRAASSEASSAARVRCHSSLRLCV